MFFSRLGPATAAHSACRGERASVSAKTQPESLGTAFQVIKNRPHHPKSRHFNLETALLPISSYLEKLAMIWILRVGLPVETQAVLPGDELSPGARACIWMQPLA